MQILKKQNTLTASVLDDFSENARQHSEACGYLTLEQENRFFRAALSNRTQLIVFPGKEKVEKIGMSSLLIMGHRVSFCGKDSEVVCFRFSGSMAATQWANLIKSKLPAGGWRIFYFAGAA